jgi:hypothetical protein
MANKFFISSLFLLFSSYFSKNLGMNYGTKLIIRGALDKIEDEKLTENKATVIRNALEAIRGGHWNVITYPTFESETGYRFSYLHWHGKQWVYAEKTTSTDYNEDEIKTFMDIEFGWAVIKDIHAVQQSAYTKINNKFPGTWRVHVARLKDGYSSDLSGTVWTNGEYTFFIYRLL